MADNTMHASHSSERVATETKVAPQRRVMHARESGGAAQEVHDAGHLRPRRHSERDMRLQKLLGDAETLREATHRASGDGVFVDSSVSSSVGNDSLSLSDSGEDSDQVLQGEAEAEDLATGKPQAQRGPEEARRGTGVAEHVSFDALWGGEGWAKDDWATEAVESLADQASGETLNHFHKYVLAVKRHMLAWEDRLLAWKEDQVQAFAAQKQKLKRRRAQVEAYVAKAEDTLASEQRRLRAEASSIKGRVDHSATERARLQTYERELQVRWQEIKLKESTVLSALEEKRTQLARRRDELLALERVHTDADTLKRTLAHSHSHDPQQRSELARRVMDTSTSDLIQTQDAHTNTRSSTHTAQARAADLRAFQARVDVCLHKLRAEWGVRENGLRAREEKIDYLLKLNRQEELSHDEQWLFREFVERDSGEVQRQQMQAEQKAHAHAHAHKEREARESREQLQTLRAQLRVDQEVVRAERAALRNEREALDLLSQEVSTNQHALATDRDAVKRAFEELQGAREMLTAEHATLQQQQGLYHMQQQELIEERAALAAGVGVGALAGVEGKSGSNSTGELEALKAAHEKLQQAHTDLQTASAARLAEVTAREDEQELASITLEERTTLLLRNQEACRIARDEVDGAQVALDFQLQSLAEREEALGALHSEWELSSQGVVAAKEELAHAQAADEARHASAELELGDHLEQMRLDVAVELARLRQEAEDELTHAAAAWEQQQQLRETALAQAEQQQLHAALRAEQEIKEQQAALAMAQAVQQQQQLGVDGDAQRVRVLAEKLKLREEGLDARATENAAQSAAVEGLQEEMQDKLHGLEELEVALLRQREEQAELQAQLDLQIQEQSAVAATHEARLLEQRTALEQVAEQRALLTLESQKLGIETEKLQMQLRHVSSREAELADYANSSFSLPEAERPSPSFLSPSKQQRPLRRPLLPIDSNIRAHTLLFPSS